MSDSTGQDAPELRLVTDRNGITHILVPYVRSYFVRTSTPGYSACNDCVFIGNRRTSGVDRDCPRLENGNLPCTGGTLETDMTRATNLLNVRIMLDRMDGERSEY